jgi:hypothetical protein
MSTRKHTFDRKKCEEVKNTLKRSIINLYTRNHKIDPRELLFKKHIDKGKA